VGGTQIGTVFEDVKEVTQERQPDLPTVIRARQRTIALLTLEFQATVVLWNQQTVEKPADVIPLPCNSGNLDSMSAPRSRSR
jgi:hypothetical protein